MATRPIPRPKTAEGPRLRVVSGSAAGRRMSVGAVVLLVLTVFCVAAMQAYAAQEGFRVASLERQVRQQEEQTTLLQARQAQLATPERLSDAAQRLGLVADPSTTFLRAPAPVNNDQLKPQQLDALRKLLASGSP
jgi:hypothetical protein